ncbi:hypothetical protein BCEN4_740101 [Burkholderia cenocepacia]|nr:hypothetical protein BCEN4_740101 [Burkholderia cenocepacia]
MLLVGLLLVLFLLLAFPWFFRLNEFLTKIYCF